ncbi:MAG: formylmethanofuran dehydrogenase [Deltaproteobacteria bacterium]|nr:MAG: formylmethanofuran dehydrogenase [Deltaproteobacteria bacterium]
MIDDLIRRGDLKGLLAAAKEFHGHICPYVAIGIRASLIGMERLGVSRLNFEESIEERIMAIVECNNCFLDGVQIATGCTVGNNSMVYLDLGKNALTLVKRKDWEGVRIYVDSDAIRDRYFPEEALALFDKVVVRREGTPEEVSTLNEKWEQIGYTMLELPEDEFQVQSVKVAPLEPAPIFRSVRCSSCGELTMEIRVVHVEGRPYCLRCAKRSFHAVIGRGIEEMQ